MPPPLDEIHADYVARYGTPRTEVVEYGRVRDYLLALNEPADLAAGTPVPALFVLTLGRTRRPQPNQKGALVARAQLNPTKTVAVHCARKGYNIRANSIPPGPRQ